MRLTPHRRFATVRAELEDFRRIRRTFGGAVNDAVVSVVGDAVGRLLRSRGYETKDLDLLFEGDPVLANPYAFLPVSADRHPHVKGDAAERFGDWLVGERGRDVIAGYRLGGENPFTVPEGGE